MSSFEIHEMNDFHDARGLFELRNEFSNSFLLFVCKISLLLQKESFLGCSGILDIIGDCQGFRVLQYFLDSSNYRGLLEIFRRFRGFSIGESY